MIAARLAASMKGKSTQELEVLHRKLCKQTDRDLRILRNSYVQKPITFRDMFYSFIFGSPRRVEPPRRKPKRIVSGSAEVNHPKHYTGHASGVECIQITEHMGFCLGNAIKYIWRADLKNNAIEDLEKARWYISREIERRQNK